MGVCVCNGVVSAVQFREVVRLGADQEGVFDYEKFVKLMVGTRKAAEE